MDGLDDQVIKMTVQLAEKGRQQEELMQRLAALQQVAARSFLQLLALCADSADLCLWRRSQCAALHGLKCTHWAA